MLGMGSGEPAAGVVGCNSSSTRRDGRLEHVLVLLL